jgi:hypothetical protein
VPDPEGAAVGAPGDPADDGAVEDPAGAPDDEPRGDPVPVTGTDADPGAGATDPEAPDDGGALTAALASGDVVAPPLPHAPTAIAARSRAVDAVINRDIDSGSVASPSPSRRGARAGLGGIVDRIRPGPEGEPESRSVARQTAWSPGPWSPGT